MFRFSPAIFCALFLGLAVLHPVHAQKPKEPTQAQITAMIEANARKSAAARASVKKRFTPAQIGTIKREELQLEKRAQAEAKGNAGTFNHLEEKYQAALRKKYKLTYDEWLAVAVGQ